MELPANEREMLAMSLWDSLETKSGMNSVSDDEFGMETEKRRAELHDGTVRSISHSELKRQLGR